MIDGAEDVVLGEICPFNGNNTQECLYNESRGLITWDAAPAGLPASEDPDDWEPCDFGGTDEAPLCEEAAP